jgi:alanyl aminopeptidase
VTPRKPRRLTSLLAALSLAACASGDGEPRLQPGNDGSSKAQASAKPAAELKLPAEAPPLGRLPADVRPLHYTLTLEIAPEKERFSGEVEIAVELSKARDVLWLHGRGLTVERAEVVDREGKTIEGAWEQVHPNGVAALRLKRPAAPGRAAIKIAYSAAFDKGMVGLYRVERSGASYAFTHFEPVRARQAFPGFDEPAFKVPFDTTLIVPRDSKAIANTREVARDDAPGNRSRVRFATTEPLPTYLIAFAVGPLDLVTAEALPPNAFRAKPLPLRGVAARGRGPELSYSLARTAEIIPALEAYFGAAYPYDKLDLIAVPERHGAMENAGAITFREIFLLVDEKTASLRDRRTLISILTHELAHMWLGDLVTMPWWDDLWLKEAAATWMSDRITTKLYPEQGFDVASLEGIHDAMDVDSLRTARQIRQEIREQHDIFNAFDDITYEKGGGVIAMFERWLGPDTFQKGVQGYLKKHNGGVAKMDDLLASLAGASGRDVAGPMRTFLDQPGVPFVEAKLTCEAGPVLKLAQSRYLPLGSTADANRTWQIPVCARYAKGEGSAVACSLLTAREGSMKLDAGGAGGETSACPKWVLPNADGAGYYRWALPPADLSALADKGYAKLSPRERLSFAQSLKAGFHRGATPAADVMAALAPLARDASFAVATKPMSFLHTAMRWLEAGPERPDVERYGRSLYAPVYRELGWEPAKKGAGAGAGAGKAEEDVDKRLLREQVVGFLALGVRDPDVRKEAVKRARAYAGFGKDGAIHPDAVDPGLAGVALAVAVQEEGKAFFDALEALLAKSEDDAVRQRILSALGRATHPELAARARALALDPRVRPHELMVPVFSQMGQIETRDATWAWFKEHLNGLIARLSARGAGFLPWVASSYCDKARVAEVSALFAPRIEELDGGPRNLASVTEAMELCAAQQAAQRESARAFFTKAKRR